MILNCSDCYRPRTKYDGRLSFHRRLSVNSGEGEGYPSLWSQIPPQPLVPCPFWGIFASSVAGPAWDWDTPLPHLELGYPPPHNPPAWTGVPPGLVMPRAVCLLWFPVGFLISRVSREIKLISPPGQSVTVVTVGDKTSVISDRNDKPSSEV